MGNNGSRSGNLTQRYPIEPEQQWAHSFPRNPHRIYQHKVLPEKDIVRKLRSTNNGEILQSGGTLSGRHYQQTLSLEREDKSFRIFRASSISSNSPDEYNHQKDQAPSRPYISRHRGVHKYTARRYENNNNNVQKERIKKFGSEPDLRNSSTPSRQNVVDKYKGKQKYKAPPPPNMLMQEKSNVNSCKWDDEVNEIKESRKVRLFKTNAELKKKISSPIKIKHSNREDSLDYRIDSHDYRPSSHDYRIESKQGVDIENMPEVRLREHNTSKVHVNYNRYSLPEIETEKKVPEFQVELKQAIENLKYLKPEREKDEKEKLKTLDHNINSRDIIKIKLKQIEPEVVEKEKESIFDIFNTDRGQPSGKESTPEKSSSSNLMEIEKKEQPSKLFYFGMNESTSDTAVYKINYPDNDEMVDHFAAKLHSYKFPLPNSSGSDMSSEMEIDDSQTSSSGIALQLRPILPKKQLEIPRFSPAAAWKLLSSVEPNFGDGTETTDDVPNFLEERIEKLSREPLLPSIQIAPRSTNDKSGDSGISGDAGPACFDDSPDPELRTNLHLPRILSRSGVISWTPQQDLGEEESSTDDEINNQLLSSTTPATFIPNQNVFSLSLPRDSYLSSHVSNKHVQSYLGLQKLKRSMSGVLGNIANKRDFIPPNTVRNENWFLSKSAPNSLNNGFNSLELPKSQAAQETGKSASLVRNAANTQNVSRIMYLPELDKLYIKNQATQKKQDRNKNKSTFRKSPITEQTNENYKFNLMASKSYDNIFANQDSSSEPEDLQDPPKEPDIKFRTPKSKRFTFQSTIRQIERRRLAEKLSREAEKKEKQRLCELEAMQRVEEEFQRKREREKASIRQQLRLFTLDEATWSSLPPHLENKVEVPRRYQEISARRFQIL